MTIRLQTHLPMFGLHLRIYFVGLGLPVANGFDRFRVSQDEWDINIVAPIAEPFKRKAYIDT